MPFLRLKVFFAISLCFVPMGRREKVRQFVTPLYWPYSSNIRYIYRQMHIKTYKPLILNKIWPTISHEIETAVLWPKRIIFVIEEYSFLKISTLLLDEQGQYVTCVLFFVLYNKARFEHDWMTPGYIIRLQKWFFGLAKLLHFRIR